MRQQYETRGLDNLLAAIQSEYAICLREKEQNLFEAEKRAEFEDLFDIFKKAAGMVGKIVCVDTLALDYRSGNAGSCNFILLGANYGCEMEISSRKMHSKNLEIISYNGEFYRVRVLSGDDEVDWKAEAICERHELICAISFYIQTDGRISPSLDFVKNEHFNGDINE